MYYDYITENNLEHTQNYMYAQYGGHDFLKAYYQTRRPFLLEDTGALFEQLQAAFSADTSGHTDTAVQLAGLVKALYTEADHADRDTVNRYVQRFEVRKRLFAEYDAQTGKPVAESGYSNVWNYILLAAAVEKAYGSFRSLKYLSCLLKLNDTLLSLAPSMEERLLLPVKMLVTREVGHVTELARRKNVILKEGGLCC